MDLLFTLDFIGRYEQFNQSEYFCIKPAFIPLIDSQLQMKVGESISLLWRIEPSPTLLVIQSLLSLLILLIIRLQILPVLDGLVSLKQKIPNTLLVLQIQGFETYDIVVVYDHPNFAIHLLLFVVVPDDLVRVVLVDGEVAEVFIYLGLVGDQVALGEHRDGGQFEGYLRGQ